MASRKRASSNDDTEAAAAAKNKHARYEYELVEEIGRGERGVVYKARNLCTGETVAMKRVLRGGDAAADRETFCLSALAGHPSVVQLKGAGAVYTATGDHFVVMELVDGGATLRSRLKRPLSEDETRAYMLPLLRAAAEAHAAGITHGDISPDNILVGARGIKLGGFGCATAESRPDEARLGALRYRAPELVTAIGLANGPRADLWSLGCVMFELLAGAPLFEPDNPDDLADEAEYLHDAFVEPDDALDVRTNLRDLSKPGRDLLVGLLSFDRNDRPTAAEELQHRWFTQTPKQRRATKRRSRKAMLRRTMRWKACEEAMQALPLWSG